MKKSSMKSKMADAPAMQNDAMEKKMQARYDAETLQRAAEVMADKHRMMAAKGHVEESMSAMKRVMGMGGGADKMHEAPKARSLGFAKKGK